MDLNLNEEDIRKGPEQTLSLALGKACETPSFFQDERLFQATIESIKDGILVVGEKGDILYRNRQLFDMWEFSEKIPDMSHPKLLKDFAIRRIKNPEAFYTRVEQLHGSREKHSDTLFLNNGKIFEYFTTPLLYSGITRGRIWTFRDITEKKRLESQLIQAQKMEAIGTLAAGMAHDFNNILMIIQGCTSLLLMDENSGSYGNRRLKEIEKHVKSAADLIQQLLGFAGKAVNLPRSIDIAELIEKTVLLFDSNHTAISIRELHHNALWKVTVDPLQFEQVFLNLMVNAWQAMPGGGTIFIESDNLMVDEENSKQFQVPCGRYVRVKISDTGIGMDQDTLKRIFEPFFTTHRMGRGSGLGLAAVYGIIKNHEGEIHVTSQKGQGSVFTIYLPVDRQLHPEKEDDSMVMDAKETILIIDDEEMVLDVGAAMLNKMGFMVLSAENGGEGIKIYQENLKDIDLVILDMVMPSSGGKETYDKLKQINPNVKVILSSGYSLNDQAAEILDSGCNDFIQKPFNMTLLSQKVRNILK
jgi:signal transduction histidine kinase